jgi:hypothetical protein
MCRVLEEFDQHQKIFFGAGGTMDVADAQHVSSNLQYLALLRIIMKKSWKKLHPIISSLDFLGEKFTEKRLKQRIEGNIKFFIL